MTNGLRTWLEISQPALQNNYQIWRRLAGQSRLMAVVKSNAYGHGLVDFSRLMQKLGADWFGVDSLTEALALRRSGITKPILVLGFTLPENLAAAARGNISLTISSFFALNNLLQRAKGRPKVHLKMDTGMHRQGFLPAEAPLLLKTLRRHAGQLKVEGVYTHFAAAKNPAFPQVTLKQIKEFEEAAALFEAAGFKPIKHAAATSGLLLFPQARFDMVRVGIGLYGLWPSQETRAAFNRSIKLEPALAWRSIISEIKKLPKGSRLGYDLTETLRQDSTVAICPVGYWHGLPRGLSSIGPVSVKDQRARILGRVCMDMMAIDVSKIKGVRVLDEVTLIGRDKQTSIHIDEVADLAGSSNYELVTRLNPLMKRVYRGGS